MIQTRLQEIENKLTKNSLKKNLGSASKAKAIYQNQINTNLLEQMNEEDNLDEQAEIRKAINDHFFSEQVEESIKESEELGLKIPENNQENLLDKEYKRQINEGKVVINLDLKGKDKYEELNTLVNNIHQKIKSLDDALIKLANIEKNSPQDLTTNSLNNLIRNDENVNPFTLITAMKNLALNSNSDIDKANYLVMKSLANSSKIMNDAIGGLRDALEARVNTEKLCVSMGKDIDPQYRKIVQQKIYEKRRL